MLRTPEQVGENKSTGYFIDRITGRHIIVCCILSTMRYGQKKGELPFPLHLPIPWYSVIVGYFLQLFKGFPTEIPPTHKVNNFHIGYLIEGGNSVCLKDVV